MKRAEKYQWRKEVGDLQFYYPYCQFIAYMGNLSMLHNNCH